MTPLFPSAFEEVIFWVVFSLGGKNGCHSGLGFGEVLSSQPKKKGVN
jgi:hypothetical protein